MTKTDNRKKEFLDQARMFLDQIEDESVLKDIADFIHESWLVEKYMTYNRNNPDDEIPITWDSFRFYNNDGG